MLTPEQSTESIELLKAVAHNSGKYRGSTWSGLTSKIRDFLETVPETEDSKKELDSSLAKTG